MSCRFLKPFIYIICLNSYNPGKSLEEMLIIPGLQLRILRHVFPTQSYVGKAATSAGNLLEM